jgi:hypothetical protein
MEGGISVKGKFLRALTTVLAAFVFAGSFGVLTPGTSEAHTVTLKNIPEEVGAKFFQVFIHVKSDYSVVLHEEENYNGGFELEDDIVGEAPEFLSVLVSIERSCNEGYVFKGWKINNTLHTGNTALGETSYLTDRGLEESSNWIPNMAYESFDQYDGRPFLYLAGDIKDDITIEAVFSSGGSDYTVTPSVNNDELGELRAEDKGENKWALTATPADGYMLDHLEYRADSTADDWAVDEDTRNLLPKNVGGGVLAYVYGVNVAEDTEYRAVFKSSVDVVQLLGDTVAILAAWDGLFYRQSANQDAPDVPANDGQVGYNAWPVAGITKDFLEGNLYQKESEAQYYQKSGIISESEAVDAYDNVVLVFKVFGYDEIDKPVVVEVFEGEGMEGRLLYTAVQPTGIDLSPAYANMAFRIPVDAMPYISEVTVRLTVGDGPPVVKTYTLGAAMNDTGSLAARGQASAAIIDAYKGHLAGSFPEEHHRYSQEFMMCREEYMDGLEAVKDAVSEEEITAALERALQYMADAAASVFHSGIRVGFYVKGINVVVTVPEEVTVSTVMCAAMERLAPGTWYLDTSNASWVNGYELTGGTGALLRNPQTGGWTYGIGGVGAPGFANGIQGQMVRDGWVICGDAALIDGTLAWDIGRLRGYLPAEELEQDTVYTSAVPAWTLDNSNPVKAEVWKALRLKYLDFLLDRETEATRGVVRQIAALDSQSTGGEVSAAKNAYQALGDTEKPGVFNYDDLLVAVAAHASADEAAALQVTTLIGQIGDVEYTAASSAKIDAAQTAYDSASVEAKELVTNVTTLTAAREAFDAIRAVMVQAAIEAIEALGGDITLNDEAAVAAAQTAYEALLAADRAAFAEDNGELYAKLQDSAATLTNLKNEAALAALGEAREGALDYIRDNAPNPEFDSVGGEWAVLALARGGDDIEDDYFSGYYERIVEYVTDEIGSAKLDENISTDNSRLILALTSIGRDPTDVGGFDLTAPYADFDWVKFQGVNGAIFTLLALDSRLYPIPEGGSEAARTTLDSLIGHILEEQFEDGGWGYSYGGSESKTANPDITGMALQALAPYRLNPDVEAAIERALDALSNIQRDDGGFGSTESNAQVITALSALGIDAATDGRSQKEGGNPLTALLSYRNADTGAFRYLGSDNQMSTEQAAYALVAYDRFVNGENSLYDMTDVNPDVPLTLSVRLQSAALTEGTAGQASFTVTRTNLPPGSYTASLSDALDGDAPDGVTVQSGKVTIADGCGTLTLNTTTATPAGSHPIKLTLTLEDATATSGAFTFVVAQASGGTGDTGGGDNNNNNGNNNNNNNNNTGGGNNSDNDNGTGGGNNSDNGTGGGTGTDTGANTDTGGAAAGTAKGVTVVVTAPFTPADSDVQAPAAVHSFVASDISQIASLPELTGVPADVIDLLTFDAELDAKSVLVANTVSVISGLSANERSEIDTSTLTPLPVFRAEVASGKTALVTMKMGLDAYAGERIGSLALLKLKSDGTTERLDLASSPQGISHAQYAWTDAAGNAISPQTVIETGKKYSVSVAVKDNSTGYDWDPTFGSVLDPLAIAEAKVAANDGGKDNTNSADGGSGGGGCDAGAGMYGVFALFALALVVERANKMRKAA